MVWARVRALMGAGGVTDGHCRARWGRQVLRALAPTSATGEVARSIAGAGAQLRPTSMRADWTPLMRSVANPSAPSFLASSSLRSAAPPTRTGIVLSLEPR